MLTCSTLLVMNTGLLSPADFHSSTASRLGLRGGHDAILSLKSRKSRAIRVLVNPNVLPSKRSSKKEVIMVDPLEAKRLAAKQMERIKAKERYKRRRKIEAINGAWAMIGLTAGLVIEAQTGKGILSQLAGYWDAFFSFFPR